MDISLVILSLILVGSVFIPFFFFNSAGKSENKIKKKIKQSIANFALNISQSENWGNKYIGIDTDRKIVLYLNFSESDNEEQQISLNHVKVCQILEKRKVIKTKASKETLLEKLDLEVSLQNGEILLLNFYDSNLNYSEDFELQRIEKWKAIIINQVSNFQVVKKVA